MDQYEQSLRRRRLSAQTIRLRLFYVDKLARHVELLGATTDDLERFLECNSRWSDSTRQSVIASIRSFYAWAASAGLVALNPAAELILPRVNRRPSRMASETEILDGLEGATVSDQAMILLGAECGLRVSEIAALHRDDRTGEWLTIVGKGNVQRTVWVSPELETLLDWIERHTMRWHCYFPGRSGGHAHPSTIWRHIRTLTGVNPHALRHRAGTIVYRRTGNDLRTAQEFLGHRRPETTAIYVHVERDDLMRAGQAARIAA